MFLDMLYGIGISIDLEKYKGADGFKKFIEWISESHRLDEYERFMDEMAREENKRFEEEQKHNNEIFDELRDSLDEVYVQNIIECLKESEADGKIEIVEKPKIEPQYEDWDSFDHILVDQYQNGGIIGDSYAGYIYIPIGGGQYLKSHYSM